MNKIVITLLCCSSFFALTLLTVNPAFAKEFSPQNLTSAKLNSDQTQTINISVTQKSPEFPSIGSTQSLEELAIQKFGCDCPACQARVSQMVLQGSLPQLK
ncbi:MULTISPECIES: hypothetical protein [unclassified Nostoc]|uniref:hypothetical protein n=1 Tax=unclassified Nostoc TaxID=2593658 RepID=UPI0026128F10|nr:hypothetical protein [Nostoc sp. S13]MDF5736978.1 hypothetical protein [Nostoc sp. S13]